MARLFSGGENENDFRCAIADQDQRSNMSKGTFIGGASIDRMLSFWYRVKCAENEPFRARALKIAQLSIQSKETEQDGSYKAYNAYYPDPSSGLSIKFPRTVKNSFQAPAILPGVSRLVEHCININNTTNRDKEFNGDPSIINTVDRGINGAPSTLLPKIPPPPSWLVWHVWSKYCEDEEKLR